jgi:alkylation response protein AidB-like acyl-CoA dehydrogenase
LRAARKLLASQAGMFWSGVSAGRIPTPAERIQTAADATWAAATATTVVDFCYTASGGSAVYDSSSLQRHFRDIHTLSQHIGVADG